MPLPNFKHEERRITLGPQDPQNRRSAGRKPPFHHPKYEVSVHRSSLEVHYTYPNPVLTPFDFIEAQANALIGQIVAFVSKYDPLIPTEMTARSEVIPGVADYDWLKGHKYPRPSIPVASSGPWTGSTTPSVGSRSILPDPATIGP